MGDGTTFPLDGYPFDNCKTKIFALSTESGPGYFKPTFSIFDLSGTNGKQNFNHLFYSVVQICLKTFIYNPKFCVQRLKGFYWDKLCKDFLAI